MKHDTKIVNLLTALRTYHLASLVFLASGYVAALHFVGCRIYYCQTDDGYSANGVVRFLSCTPVGSNSNSRYFHLRQHGMIYLCAHFPWKGFFAMYLDVLVVFWACLWRKHELPYLFREIIQLRLPLRRIQIFFSITYIGSSL